MPKKKLLDREYPKVAFITTASGPIRELSLSEFDRQNLQIPQQMGTIVLAGEMFGIIIMQLSYLLEQKLLQQFLVKHYSMTSLMINSSILVIFLKKKKKQDLEMPEHLILLLMVNML
nr:hypothetical protein [Proteus mirabilis]